FASTDDTIYDITTVTSPYNWRLSTENDDNIVTENDDFIGQTSTSGLEVYVGTTNGNWNTTQFATVGGIFVVGFNGEDNGFVYDGTAFNPLVDGGIWTISYDAEVTPVQVGEVITGSESGATGTVIEVIEGAAPGEGGLVISNPVYLD